MRPLAVAAFAFAATDDISSNAKCLQQALVEAAQAGARVLLTPECALIGYPSAARADLKNIDWCRVADEEDALEMAARKSGIVLVLGTASPWSGVSTSRLTKRAAVASNNNNYSNDALVLNAGMQPLRYRKRALTPTDLNHFIAGDVRQMSTIRVDDWHLGLSICYELRFGALWAQQAKAGVDAFLHIAHMAGFDADPGTKTQVIPNLYSARAAEWATPLLVANTSAPDRWVDSGYWDARGVRVATQAEGLLHITLQPRTTLAPWYNGLRNEALRRS